MRLVGGCRALMPRRAFHGMYPAGGRGGSCFPDGDFTGLISPNAVSEERATDGADPRAGYYAAM